MENQETVMETWKFFFCKVCGNLVGAKTIFLQCLKLRMHPAPGVHNLVAGCTHFDTTFLYIKWACAQEKHAGCTILCPSAPDLVGAQNTCLISCSTPDFRYLSRTFHMAYSAVRPDVVVFMGDLLDEGSTSRGDVYRGYHDRFNRVFLMNNDTKVRWPPLLSLP